MKKFKINVEENLRFNHTYNIELPKGVDEEKVWCEIDRAEHRDDIFYIIQKHGGNVIDWIEDGSPYCNLEVDDVE